MRAMSVRHAVLAIAAISCAGAIDFPAFAIDVPPPLLAMPAPLNPALQKPANPDSKALGWLGLSVSAVPPPGAGVVSVVPNGPAAQAALQQGDVIVAIGGKSTEDPRDVASRVAALLPDSTVAFTALRDGTSRTLSARIGTQEERQEAATKNSAPGVTVAANASSAVTPQCKDLFYRGMDQAKAGNHREAIRLYGELLKQCPQTCPAMNNTGSSYNAIGDSSHARLWFDAAVRCDPKNQHYKTNAAATPAPPPQTKSQTQATTPPVKQPTSLPQPPPQQPKIATQTSPNAAITPQQPRTPPQGAVTTAPPTVAPAQPNAVGARILTPFTGYKMQDTCGQANLKLAGAPWRSEDSGATGPAETSRLGRYQALLRHTMQGLRLLYGTMTAVEERNFDAFWAPFFDHPTQAGLDYFEKIAPLLDEMVEKLATLDGTLPEFGEALQSALITDADPTSGAVGLADTLYRQVKAESGKLDAIAKKIESLGNPPNPLAAKCRAQRLHRKAIGASSTISFFDLAQNAAWLSVMFRDQTDYQFGLSTSQPLKFSRTFKSVSGDTITFLEVAEGFDKKTCGMAERQPARAEYFPFQKRLELRFDPSHSRIIEASGRVDVHACVFLRDLNPQVYNAADKIYGISEENVVRTIDFRVSDIPVTAVKYSSNHPTWGWDAYISFAPQDFPRHVVSWSGTNDISYFFKRGRQPSAFKNVSIEIAANFGSRSTGPGGNIVRADGMTMQAWWSRQTAGDQLHPTLTQLGPQQNIAGQQNLNTVHSAVSNQPDPATDPKLIAEAIADHVALANQIRNNAARWAADAAKETDKDRKTELLKRAQETNANAQAEEDIANSLRTGVIVHTRTDWDNAQHQALVNKIKTEVATFDVENKLLRNIPKVADMLAGAEGVSEREAINKQISEAIKSPDAAKKLGAIYTGLKGKVVDQGARQMAAEQEKVEMWDRRVQIAERVQATAEFGIMLATFWNPATMGTLALGYAGATGFAEDGVKGGAKAVARSVSGKVDAVLSAYEGATRIDSATGEPAGVWGAVEGALWSIGTNKLFEGAGARIQRAKAQYALAAQAKGGLGFKPVAKATREARIKEFDFKTPEERFHADAANAKTPAEQAAVQKKHAILVEREAMGRDMDIARQNTEAAVRSGIDPATAKEKYNNDLAAIHEKYKAKETRNQEHQEVMKELGFDQNYDKTNNDIKPTGSNPETASSDMDFTPAGATPHEAYQKGKQYTEAMIKRGHNVVEYGDRWVDTTSDTTVWKPGFGADKPGSSSFEAEVIFGTLPHSDKFGTKGGIEWTSTGKTDDPLGAVLANTGKAVAAGVGNAHPVDLHTVGKSAVKAAQAAGIEVDPALKSQIDALRAHQTPEQAGVLTLGADQATKDKETKAFLDKVQNLLTQAYGKAKATSDSNIKSLEQQAAAKGTSDEAFALRARAKAYQSGNDAALTTIAKVSPGLAAKMAPSPPASSVAPELASGNNLNLGGLAKSLTQDREAALATPPLPADGNDKAFAGLKDRCKEAAKRAETKRAAAKPGSEEAVYLANLKVALEQGAANPAEAIRSIRALSGHELADVLAELGVPAATNK